MAIASDALRMALELEIVGANEAISTLNNLNSTIDQINGKSKKAAEALDMQRLAVEGRYNPDAQRELELKQLIALQDKLNLSTETYRQMKQEIQNKFTAATSPAIGPMQDQHITDYVRAQKQADQEVLASKERAAKETARLQEQELSNYQRLLAKYAEFDKQLASGIIDDAGYTLRKNNAVREYNEIQDAEAKKAQLKQDALDKQEAADLAAAAKRQKLADDETRRITLEMAKRKQATVDAGVDATQRRAAAIINAQEAADKAANAERQKAIALMNGYSSVSERAANDIAYFNSALTAGTITAEEHSRAIEGVNRRLRSMAGGAGNMGYVVGNVMTGLEDFTTVLSITGFGMDGFAAATRSASNNVGQAVRSMGTAASAIYAPLVSIGMVLIGFAIPAAYKWATGAEDAAEATKKWKDELDALIRSANYWNSIQLLTHTRRLTELEVGEMNDPDELVKKITETLNKMHELDLKIQGTKTATATEAAKIFDDIIDPNGDFSHLADAFGNVIGADKERELRDSMERIRLQFVDDVGRIGGEKARQELERNIRLLTQSMGAELDEMSALQRKKLLDMANELANPGGEGTIFNESYFNDFINLFPEFMNEAQIIDRIQDAKERLAEISADSTEAARKEREELVSLGIQLELLLEQRMKAIAARDVWEAGLRLGEEVNNRAELENDLEMLRIQNTKNRLLGDENEAERKLLDLALRRREIMESGLAAPDILENMFDAELEALAAQIEKDLAKMEEITVKTDAQTQASAYTQANKMILEVKKDSDEVRQKEMVQLLTSIRDHLAGKNILNVELM